MRALSRLWPLLILAACDGGGSSSGSAGAGSSGRDDESCRLTTAISGGLEASLSGESAVCAYTSRAVSLAEIGGDRVVLLVDFDDALEPLQTGTFGATIEVRQGNDSWTGARCSVVVESNVKVSSADAGRLGFDNYLLKGTGSCSTPGTYRDRDGGAAKAPVDIAPFTFALRVLFY